MGIHEGKIEEQKEEQKEKDDAIKERLDEHDDKLEGHKDDLGEHKVTLDEHDTKLKTHTHQLRLVKTALDGEEDVHGTGLGFGYKRTRGHPSADKLIDWDCRLDSKGQMVMTDEQDSAGNLLPEGPRRMTRAAQEEARSNRVAADRRRLANRPKSHVIVLEQLMDEINR